jgi:hypothetical protein
MSGQRNWDMFGASLIQLSHLTAQKADQLTGLSDD